MYEYERKSLIISLVKNIQKRPGRNQLNKPYGTDHVQQQRSSVGESSESVNPVKRSLNDDEGGLSQATTQAEANTTSGLTSRSKKNSTTIRKSAIEVPQSAATQVNAPAQPKNESSKALAQFRERVGKKLEEQAEAISNLMRI